MFMSILIAILRFLRLEDKPEANWDTEFMKFADRARNNQIPTSNEWLKRYEPKE